jgi:hypothetical protein
MTADDEMTADEIDAIQNKIVADMLILLILRRMRATSITQLLIAHKQPHFAQQTNPERNSRTRSVIHHTPAQNTNNTLAEEKEEETSVLLRGRGRGCGRRPFVSASARPTASAACTPPAVSLQRSALRVEGVGEGNGFRGRKCLGLGFRV